MSLINLKLRELSCERGNRPLFQNLSFEVNAGEILQILGPNGVGKSTLLKTLSGLRPIDRGEIFWQGQAITESLEIYQEHLSYLGHRLGLKASLTVLENLNLDPRFSVDLSQFNSVLKLLGLTTLVHQRVSQLSQGQKQRLALAGILLANRKIWILDEPFASLDPAIIQIFESLILEHAQKGGCVILSSHRPLTLAEHKIKTVVLESAGEYI